jgi:hypothetical protein
MARAKEATSGGGGGKGIYVDADGRFDLNDLNKNG